LNIEVDRKELELEYNELVEWILELEWVLVSSPGKTSLVVEFEALGVRECVITAVKLTVSIVKFAV
jgi:hypothetical protein